MATSDIGAGEKAKRSRKRLELKPKSERDRELPEPWNKRKGRGGRKKQFSTEGFYCSNPSRKYYRITNEQIHALVANGKLGTKETIQDLKCQACGKMFTARRDTNLYRLKTHSGLVEKIVWLSALAVDASALEEVFGVREITIRTRLCRSGMQGRKLLERLNLTIRQCVSKLTRRTWGPARFSPELMDHLAWWRSYYHFVRLHESLAEVLEKPHQHKGKLQPRRYRCRTQPRRLGWRTGAGWERNCFIFLCRDYVWSRGNQERMG